MIENKSRKIAEAVQRAEEHSEHGPPFLTVGEIANALDISAPTVRRFIDDVMAIEGMQSATIGRADIYWFDGGDLDKESIGREWDEGELKTIPPEALHRATARGKSVRGYIRDLIQIEDALSEAGFERQ